MTINLWHCIIINFTSLALEGVYNRLSQFKVLTQSHGNAGRTTNNRLANHQQLPQIMQTTCRNATTVYVH